MERSTAMAMAMKGLTVMATETAIDGSTAMDGSTATATAMNSTEIAIDGSTAKEGSIATATVKKSTLWKGLAAMAMAMEADGGLDSDGNGINN